MFNAAQTIFLQLACGSVTSAPAHEAGAAHSPAAAIWILGLALAALIVVKLLR